MSKVALIVEDFSKQKAACLKLISRTLSLPISDIAENVGLNLPAAEHAIFDRQSPEFATSLVHALRNLTNLGCYWRALELLDGQTWQPSDTYFEITEDRLSMRIAARLESMAEQARFAELERGSDS